MASTHGMGNGTHPGVARALERFARAVAVAVAVCGVLVLGGWAFGMPALTRVHPESVSMPATTAACLVLAGVALWLRGREGRTTPVAAVCAGLVVAVAATTLAEHAFGVDLAIETTITPGPSPPIRMALLTAVVLVLLGTSLVVVDLGPCGRHAASWCALAAGAVLVFRLPPTCTVSRASRPSRRTG